MEPSPSMRFFRWSSKSARSTILRIFLANFRESPVLKNAALSSSQRGYSRLPVGICLAFRVAMNGPGIPYPATAMQRGS